MTYCTRDPSKILRYIRNIFRFYPIILTKIMIHSNLKMFLINCQPSDHRSRNVGLKEKSKRNRKLGKSRARRPIRNKVQVKANWGHSLSGGIQPKQIIARERERWREGIGARKREDKRRKRTQSAVFRKRWFHVLFKNKVACSLRITDIPFDPFAFLKRKSSQTRTGFQFSREKSQRQNSAHG